MEHALNASVYGLGLAAVAWAAARPRLFDAAWRCRIWGAALLGLAGLLAWAAIDWASATRVVAGGLEVGPAGPMIPGPGSRPEGLIRLPAIPVPVTLALGAWSSVVLWRVCRLAVAVVRIRAARAAAQPFPSVRLAQLPEWVAANDGRFTLMMSDRVAAPSMLGFGRPMVAVPPGWLARLSDEALDAVLLHEMAHAERRDDLVDLAQGLVLAACWFHPAAWWTAGRIAFEREAACDERAARLTTTRRYARCLVRIAEATQHERWAARPLVASSAGRRRQVVRRVERVIALSRRGRLASSRYLAAPVVAAIVGLAGAGPVLPPIFTVMPSAQTPLADASGPTTGTAGFDPAGFAQVVAVETPVSETQPAGARPAQAEPVNAPPTRTEPARAPKQAQPAQAGHTQAKPTLARPTQTQAQAEGPATTVTTVEERAISAAAPATSGRPATDHFLSSKELTGLHASTIVPAAPSAAGTDAVVRGNGGGMAGVAAPFRTLGVALGRAGAGTGRWFARAGASVATGATSR